VQRHIK